MRVKVKRSGTIFIGVTVFLGVAAANTGNNLLYMLVSAMLSLMLVSGISSLLNIRGIEVYLIPPFEVFAGRRATFRVILRKRGKLPSFLIRISSGIDEKLLPFLNGKGREETLDFLFPERGLVKRVSLELSSDFPLGMFTRVRSITVDVNLVVFPFPLKTTLPLKSSDTLREGSSAVSLTSAGYEDLKSVRDYRGEPMKLVHWKLSAKRDKLLVKEMMGEKREPVVLKMDMVEGDLETKLSKLTYLTIRLIDEGYPVGLELKDKRIPPKGGNHQKHLILRELALY
jgi:uncharacterized protein (DUF58 family)